MHIPIIGNGDVTTPQRAKECFDKYGVDAVMIGRAALAVRGYSKEIKHYLETGEELTSLSFEWKMQVLREEVLNTAWNVWMKEEGIVHIRRHPAATLYLKAYPTSGKHFIAMLRTESVKELFEIFETIKPAEVSE